MTRKTTPHIADGRLSLLILVCFFFSGLTALIYEIIWMRMIGEVIGGAPFAVSAILFVFMGGMGGGSFLASRRIDNFNTTRLIRAYGSLEILIGIYAFFVPIILLVFKFIYVILYNALADLPLIYNFFIFLGALLLLGIPTLCMGATLPILCKFYVSRLSHLGTHTGRLYGINTIGAAAGSLICGFWMIQSLGVWGTMLIAAGVNITIGFVCLSLSPQALPVPRDIPQHRKKTSNDAVPETESEREYLTEAFEAPESGWTIHSALILFFISGFSAMAYEVIWTKLLGLLVGPTTYSFTIVLATFIVGLSLGNMIFGWLADKMKNTIMLLIAAQIAAAFLALAASQIMGNSQLFFTKLIFNFKDQFTALSLAKAVALFLLMMPPTLFLGASFPLVAKIYSRSLLHIGRSIGIAYSINTIGAVLGSVCAGLLLIPFVGKENGLKIVIGLQLSSAIVVGFITLTRQKAAGLKFVGLTVATAAGLYLCIAYPAWNRQLLAKGKYHRFEEVNFAQEILPGVGWLEALFKGADILAPLEFGELVYYGDGIGGFTTVLKYPGPFGKEEYSLANSGKMDASSHGDMNTQTALAHVPMLFAENPEQVMVLGLASGITAGEVLHYPIKHLDVVDINDRVEEACRYFSPWNNHVLDDPRTKLIFQDGRAHLALTDKQYDVIISEPSNPWMAGMAALFTKDFFQLAEKRLTEKGVYVQWFHCYQMDWPTFTLIGRTFANVFPNGMLVSTSPQGFGRDYLLVGFKSKSGANWKNAHKAIKYLQKSGNISMAEPELYARQIVSEDFEFLFGQGPLNTDDLPLLEFTAPKLMFTGRESSGAILHYLASYPGLSDETKELARRKKEEVKAAIEFATYAFSIHSPFRDMVDLSKTTQTQKNQYYDVIKEYGRHNPIDFSMISDPALVEELRDMQIEILLNRIKKSGAKESVTYAFLARLYDEKGLHKKAISYLKRAVALDPNNATNHNNLGYLLDQQGETEAALHYYREALRVNPYSIISLGNLAFLNLKRDRLDKALDYFEKILQIQPDQPEALFQIGKIHLAQKETGQAAEYLKKALEIDPNYKEARQALSQINLY